MMWGPVVEGGLTLVLRQAQNEDEDEDEDEDRMNETVLTSQPSSC
jgi:hypothetical protein